MVRAGRAGFALAPPGTVEGMFYAQGSQAASVKGRGRLWLGTVLAPLVLATGCQTNAGTGLLAGGALGALAGGAIGAATHHAGEGALIGAAAGATLGGVTGAAVDNHQQKVAVRRPPRRARWVFRTW